MALLDTAANGRAAEGGEVGMKTSDFISKSSLCKHLQVEIGSPEGNEYLMKVNNIIIKEPFVNQNNGCCKDKNEPLKISRDWVNEFYGYVAVCPECDCFWIMYRDEDMKFCPGCGQEVKWNERKR